MDKRRDTALFAVITGAEWQKYACCDCGNQRTAVNDTMLEGAKLLLTYRVIRTTNSTYAIQCSRGLQVIDELPR